MLRSDRRLQKLDHHSITVNGNYFYIIIDRSGDTENVYFLNLVDEADLFALMETEEETAETEPETEPVPTCICEDKCIIGEVNPKCAVCKLDSTESGALPLLRRDLGMVPWIRPQLGRPAESGTAHGSSAHRLFLGAALRLLARGRHQEERHERDAVDRRV